MVIEDAIIENGIIYFILQKYMGVFISRLDCDDAGEMIPIPGFPFVNNNIGSKIELWNGVIIIVIKGINEILLYNLKSKEWSGIKLEKGNDVYQMTVYEGVLYMYGCNTPYILAIKLDTREINRMHIEDFCKNEHGVYAISKRYGAKLFGNRYVFPLANADKVLIYDMNTNKYHFDKYDGSDYRLEFRFDGKQFYEEETGKQYDASDSFCKSMNNNHRVVQEDGEIRVYDSQYRLICKKDMVKECLCNICKYKGIVYEKTCQKSYITLGDYIEAL